METNTENPVTSLEDIARHLAESQTSARRGGEPILLSLLDTWSTFFHHAQQELALHTDQKLELPPAAEWLLDNYYLVQQTIWQIRHDLPESFYRLLPLLKDAPFRDLPRVFALARELTAACEIHLEPEGVHRFVTAYQDTVTLTIGELWALPTMLRLATLEELNQAVAVLLGSSPNGKLSPGEIMSAQEKEESSTVANCILNLRAINIEDWKNVFEDLSLVEHTLRRDPARIHARMNFETRDRYRKVVEEIALKAGLSEVAVAEAVVALADEGARMMAEGRPPPISGQARSHLRSVHPTSWIRKSSGPEPDPDGGPETEKPTIFSGRISHVGFYLLDQGRAALERRLGYSPSIKIQIRRRFAARSLRIYLSSIVLLSILIAIGITSLAAVWGGNIFQMAAAFLIALVPAITIAVSLVNTVVPRLVQPHILPKMDFQNGIPDECSTLVVIPAILSSPEEIRTLLRRMEQHYLSTLDSNLHFALLTDFPDAPHESMPGDEALVAQAQEGILLLNKKYGTGQRTPFHLLHRARKWNPHEGVWMGWERKRGKLVELSRLLSGSMTSSYRVEGDVAALPEIRYVITLDADSLLTRGGARNMIATLAHPLNQAEFDPQTGALVAGYTVLQPRVRVNPSHINRTFFTRLFAGDPGLDLYTQAISDIYQDLFHEGSYVGKGILDVGAFHHCLEGRVPENALLSHDLFEGILGRAGLVTDVVVLEAFPSHYLASAERLHRWTRGDWQLLPWLFSWVPDETGGMIPNDLSALDRWKILDNMRRSLLAPSMLAFLLMGWFLLPGPAILWTILGLLAPGASILAGLAIRFRLRRPFLPSLDFLRPLWMDLVRWILAVVFLPFEALLIVDAIVTTLIRLAITRQRLLEWIPAASIASFFEQRVPQMVVWRRMVSAPAVSLVVTLLFICFRLSMLPLAGTFLLAWFFSPQIAQWISQPIRFRQPPLSSSQKKKLRGLARRTWLFYESFVGPEDNWLPPDHFQELPRGQAAHHTSPTNIGFLLLSCLAASDLGYMGPFGLMLRLNSTLNTLDKLQRYRGHFLNWYDTRTLTPLPPSYVSTVDSGNLAGCLIALSQACFAMPNQPIFRWQRWQGMLDTLSLLGEATEFAESKIMPPIIQAELNEIERQIQAVQQEPARWIGLLESLSSHELPKLENLLVQLVETGPQILSSEIQDGIRMWLERVRHHLMSMRREVGLLLPWLVLLEDPPAMLVEPDGAEVLKKAWHELKHALPVTPTLGEIPEICRRGEVRLHDLKRLLEERSPLPAGGPETDRQLSTAWAWCTKLASALASARLEAEDLLHGYRDEGEYSESLVSKMDFNFLFDPRQQVFHLGYNLDAVKLDDNHYDLLASEARLASLVAIAKRDVPISHWLHLGRPLTRVDDSLALLSWSGTTFEYLMPLLLMRSFPDTLLDQSCRAVVRRQERYAISRDVPWGISESGYYAFDTGMNYQYRAFGVPSLGLKRSLGNDLVVAPYASLLALPLAAADVVENIARFTRLGMVGPYGLYESMDYTPTRVPIGQPYARVQSYMAHHHGMALVALTNALEEEVMVRRFHADPRIRTVELLLQEQLPVSAHITEVPPPVVTPVHTAHAQVSLTSWCESAQAPSPRVHFLSNGRYGVMITSAGGGYSQWQNFALTRWRMDPTLDNWGTWVYLKDRDSGRLWSMTFQPIAEPSDASQTLFYPYKAEFHRQEDNLVLKMEVTVAADDDLEIRHLTLTNHSDRTRHLSVASFGEVTLSPPDVDQRHPAFNKLFIESEFLAECNALLFHRRPRSAEEEPVYLLHMLVGNSIIRSAIGYESDRALFLGRGNTPRQPAALQGTGFQLSGTTGTTLDPIMALSRDLELAPRATVRMAFVTIAGGTRSEVLALARRYQTLPVIGRAFDQAREKVEHELRGEELTTEDLMSFDRLLSALLYPNDGLRAEAQTLGSNTKGQRDLWGFGISGDFPILLVRLKSEEENSLVRDVLRAHAFWRRRGIKVDVVVLVEKESGYGQELQGELYRLIVQLGSDRWLNQHGGIYIVNSDQMAASDHVLLETAARAIVYGSRGTLAAQLCKTQGEPNRLPAFSPTLSIREDVEPTPPLPRPTGLKFDNGLGGFSPDGSEYQIYLEPGRSTPKPWINVISNPHIGCMISESGAGCTWVENSSENRLTPWANDPVSDNSGECLYLRDEETAVVWSPTPQPVPAPAPYLIRHGAGYTVFEHQSHGLRQQMRVFIVPDSPVKVVALRLENLWQRQRRLTATYYAQWVLGTSPDAAMQYLVSEYEPDANALLARNPYGADFAGRFAFLASSQRPHGLTADRTEFLGPMGEARCPAALTRVGLASTIRAGLDPCAAIQMHVELKAGEAKEIFFLLGEGADREEAVSLARRYCDSAKMEAAWQGTRAGWDELLGTISVTTPDPSMDLMLNRWLPYQTLSCRMWGRTALYQSSGAFGFRDQLQDAMSLALAAPRLAREHILQAARHQFEEGDVLHWWHPPFGRGIRTRCSDDLLWLPFVTAHYVETTGDAAILSERAAFLKGDPLQPEEVERYGLFPSSAETGTLYEHCRRALEKGSTAGVHGLPLIGSGDWNDGLNRVGIAGRGESVWLGWFHFVTLCRFSILSESMGHQEEALEYRRRAEALRAALESYGWDGRWYRRATYDDGGTLGSAEDQEWRIDSVAQSWAVLSGAADPERAEQAMREVKERLVKPEDGLVLLADPPFDRSPRDPGYIKGYPPGVRENGGDYHHAAIWTAFAFLEVGFTEDAFALFRMISPVNRASTKEGMERYQVEPYIVAADISNQENHKGRGGWTWYTGSAGWMFRLGLEGILGFRRLGDILRIDPWIPKDWLGFRIRYRFGRTFYQIDVQNPDGISRGVGQVLLDGTATPDGQIPLLDDGGTHSVVVQMG